MPESSVSRVALGNERLSFRELDAADEPFVAALVGDDEVMRFYPEGIRRLGAEFWLTRQRERYERDGHGLWLVSLRVGRAESAAGGEGGEGEATGAAAEGEPVALIGLNMQHVDGAIEPEIGYLVHRPYWRRGIASEGAACVRDYAFERCGYPYVISLIRPVNTPSAGVARKLGMRPWKRALFSGLDHDVYRLDAPARAP